MDKNIYYEFFKMYLFYSKENKFICDNKKIIKIIINIQNILSNLELKNNFNNEYYIVINKLFNNNGNKTYNGIKYTINDDNKLKKNNSEIDLITCNKLKKNNSEVDLITCNKLKKNNSEVDLITCNKLKKNNINIDLNPDNINKLKLMKQIIDKKIETYNINKLKLMKQIIDKKIETYNINQRTDSIIESIKNYYYIEKKSKFLSLITYLPKYRKDLIFLYNNYNYYKKKIDVYYKIELYIIKEFCKIFYEFELNEKNFCTIRKSLFKYAIKFNKNISKSYDVETIMENKNTKNIKNICRLFELSKF